MIGSLAGIAARSGICKNNHYIALVVHEGETFIDGDGWDDGMITRGSLERGVLFRRFGRKPLERLIDWTAPRKATHPCTSTRKDEDMKTIMPGLFPMLIAAGCSQPDAANTRSDGSTNDQSEGHENDAANAHSGSTDMAAMTPAPGDCVATRGYKQSMMKMMQRVPPYTGDADIDFNKQMHVHHLAAIDMAEVQIAQGANRETKALARKQAREVAQINTWLQKRSR